MFRMLFELHLQILAMQQAETVARLALDAALAQVATDAEALRAQYLQEQYEFQRSLVYPIGVFSPGNPQKT